MFWMDFWESDNQKENLYTIQAFCINTEANAARHLIEIFFHTNKFRLRGFRVHYTHGLMLDALFTRGVRYLNVQSRMKIFFVTELVFALKYGSGWKLR